MGALQVMSRARELLAEAQYRTIKVGGTSSVREPKHRGRPIVGGPCRSLRKALGLCLTSEELP